MLILPLAFLLVAHGGGQIDDRVVCNCPEALNHHYEQGVRYFELDFNMLDFRIVLSHDPDRPAVMTLNQLYEWMHEHPEAQVITDSKYASNLAILWGISLTAGPLMSRFWPQIYHPSELKPTLQMGFQRPIFTLYRVQNKQQAVDWASTQGLHVTVDHEAANSLRLNEVVYYVHTVNEPLERDRWRALGASGIYTDNLLQ